VRKLVFIGVPILLISSIGYSYTYTGNTWDKNTVLYKYDSSVPSSYHQSMTNGADAWLEENSEFKFEKKAWYQSTENTVYMNDSIDSVAVMTPWVYAGTNELSRFRIDFNDDLSWSTTAESDKYDVWNVAAHEFGHGLGMGHSSYTDATMYSQTEKGEREKRYLSQDDVDGVTALY